MLGLTSGELTLVALLVFAVVSAKFWPAVGAAIAVRLAGPWPRDTGLEPGSESGPGTPGVQGGTPRPPKSERTQSSNST